MTRTPRKPAELDATPSEYAPPVDVLPRGAHHLAARRELIAAELDHAAAEAELAAVLEPTPTGEREQRFRHLRDTDRSPVALAAEEARGAVKGARINYLLHVAAHADEWRAAFAEQHRSKVAGARAAVAAARDELEAVAMLPKQVRRRFTMLQAITEGAVAASWWHAAGRPDVIPTGPGRLARFDGPGGLLEWLDALEAVLISSAAEVAEPEPQLEPA